MGSRGPKKRPTALAELMGNPGKRTLNTDEPMPPLGAPEPPAFLKADARPYWDAMLPILIAMRCATVADAFPLARYCNALSRYVALETLFDGKETTYPIKDDKGRVRYWAELPQASELRKLHHILNTYEGHFGMSPSARSRLTVTVDAAKSAAADPARDAENARKRDFFARGTPGARPIASTA